MEFEGYEIYPTSDDGIWFRSGQWPRKGWLPEHDKWILEDHKERGVDVLIALYPRSSFEEIEEE